MGLQRSMSQTVGLRKLKDFEFLVGSVFLSSWLTDSVSISSVSSGFSAPLAFDLYVSTIVHFWLFLRIFFRQLLTND